MPPPRPSPVPLATEPVRSRGYLCLLLHAHLPFVRHPERPGLLEERWLFEALTECYLPLLAVLDALLARDERFRLTLSISPTLGSMLRDRLLRERFLAHLERLIRLAEDETRRVRNDAQLGPLAAMYVERFREARRKFASLAGDLVEAFGELSRRGAIELITCPATHAYLPLLRDHGRAVAAQVEIGVRSFERMFGAAPAGMWLPECGYYPGLEAVLRDAGVRYFVVEAHGVLNADVQPHYGTFAPVACPNGVAAFPRDPESSRQVWSASDGYPAHPDYREYYRDIGFDLDARHLRSHLLDGRLRVATGIKYHRITGPGRDKLPYDPARAAERARDHAQHFLDHRVRRIAESASAMDRPALIVAPFDAELFGHWWYEGPLWLREVVGLASRPGSPLELTTPADYLERHPILQRATPSASSWGSGGYNACWLDGVNSWIYPHLLNAARRLTELAHLHRNEPAGTLLDRALRQAARNLLLAQASDWPFMLHSRSAPDYARRRLREHLSRFAYLARRVRSGCVDEGRLAALEELDALFPDLDYRVYCRG